MRWDAVLWILVGIVSFPLVRAVWPRLEARQPRWSPYFEAFAPWLHGIGPAYVALITGAVLTRDFGLARQGTEAWVGGSALCIVWLVVNDRLRPAQAGWPPPVRGALDEPRWALYRAGAALWVSQPQMALLVGLGLAVGEWGLSWVGGAEARRWTWLARAASSSLIYALTGNFWLTLVTQALGLELAQRRRT